MEPAVAAALRDRFYADAIAYARDMVARLLDNPAKVTGDAPPS